MNDNMESLVDIVKQHAQPLSDSPADYDTLIEAIGDAQFVLLGEASHGTHEFYRARAEITRCLIMEKGFNIVAVEADWPDAYRVNRYIQNIGPVIPDAIESLSGFQRFPTWMWRNADVLDFIGWMRSYNDAVADLNMKVGFYGLDLYSLYTSIQAVVQYLEKVDPEAARRARYRYSCFDHYGEDLQSYGYAANFGLSDSCEKAVISQLTDLQHNASEYLQRDGSRAPDELFYAEQNARLAKNAEQYYRSMFQGRISSWNLRDSHMFETLGNLMEYVKKRRGKARAVIWEHNSHVGDARATEIGQLGELNVGQMAREKYGQDAYLVGFTTHSGTVTAASDWDAPAERKRVRPALSGSYEELFHNVGIPRFMLNITEIPILRTQLHTPRLERAIGVIYSPGTERQSHYFYARLASQFDTILHFDTTRAVEPLERTVHWQKGEVPETYPFAV